MGWTGLDPDTQWLISSVTEWGLILLLIYWYKFEKKETKKRKPRSKKEIKVVVPTTVKMDKGDFVEDGVQPGQ